MTTVAVDAMGSDRAPSMEIAGAVALVRTAPVEVILVGDGPRLEAELRRLGAARHPQLRVHHASEVVGMSDHPAKAYRTKLDSSLRVTVDLVAGGKADAMVSAGNSGAVLAHAIFGLGRLPHVDRPAIVTEFPTPAGSLVLCDMGANVDVKPTMLAQFAVLGAAYDIAVHGHRCPRVGLLSNGAEPTKGTELTRAAYALLSAASDLGAEAGARRPFEFLGYVEGNELFSGAVDVVATDGFTGNAVLKACEGFADVVFGLLRTELASTRRTRAGAALAEPALAAIKRRIHYAETGGALLAGVRGVVTICHGRSDLDAIKNAIAMADRFATKGVVDRVGQAIAQLAPLWAANDAEPSKSATLAEAKAAD